MKISISNENNLIYSFITQIPVGIRTVVEGTVFYLLFLQDCLFTS